MEAIEIDAIVIPVAIVYAQSQPRLRDDVQRAKPKRICLAKLGYRADDIIIPGAYSCDPRIVTLFVSEALPGLVSITNTNFTQSAQFRPCSINLSFEMNKPLQ